MLAEQRSSERGPRLGRRSGLISRRRGPTTDWVRLPPRSAYFTPRRLAARNRTSLAHVTGLASSASAAVWICCFSASVSGMSMLAVLRSCGSLGGRPRLLSMPINISMENSPSILDPPTNYIYDKYSNKKPRRNLAGSRRGNEIELSPNSA